jgi:hypothetical protein
MNGITDYLQMGAGSQSSTTSFAGGTATTRMSVSLIGANVAITNPVPGWNSAGTVQSVGLSATTTAPVPGTTSFNNVSYRQLGPKEWEVAYIFSATGNWANVGNGDYLFTLPNGLRFDTTLPFQPVFQGNVMASSFASKFYMLTGPNVASTSFSNGGNGSVFGAGPVIWDATRWRLMSSDTGNSGNRAVSNAYWGGNSTTQWNVRFQFTSL